MGVSPMAFLEQAVGETPMPPMKPPLNLTISALAGKPYVPFVKKHLKQAFLRLRAPLHDLTVIFVGDRRMSELHRQFMNLPIPTDVLTFPIDEDNRSRPLTGEVYVCIPEARRQARRRGTPVAHEVLLYALHGMLHLCGFDDRTDADYRKMHRTEDQILTRLGIGRVFDSIP
jgi:probable rRNA maturation factor